MVVVVTWNLCDIGKYSTGFAVYRKEVNVNDYTSESVKSLYVTQKYSQNKWICQRLLRNRHALNETKLSEMSKTSMYDYIFTITKQPVHNITEENVFRTIENEPNKRQTVVHTRSVWLSAILIILILWTC